MSALDDIRRNTTRFRATPMAEAALYNLTHLTAPAAGRVNREGELIFACGAGTSLTQSLAKLKAAQDSGIDVTIAAVNTTAPAVVKAGLRINYLFIQESMSMYKGEYGKRQDTVKPEDVDHVIVDLTTAPDVWHRWRDKVKWICAPHLWLAPQLARLGIRPFHHTGAAMTACAQFFVEQGARVCLIGNEFAFIDEKGCADGAGWEGLKVRIEDGRVLMEGREDRDHMHLDNGIPPIARNRQGILRPGRNGPVYSTSDFELQRLSLAHTASAYPGQVFNGSFGVEIDGAPFVDVKDMIEMDSDCVGDPEIITVDPVPMLEAMRDEAANTLTQCKRVLNGEQEHAIVTAHCGIVEHLASADMFALDDLDIGPYARISGRMEAMCAAAAKVVWACREALEEA